MSGSNRYKRFKKNDTTVSSMTTTTTTPAIVVDNSCSSHHYNDFWSNKKEYNMIVKKLYLGSDLPVKDKRLMDVLDIGLIITIGEEPIADNKRFNGINYVYVEAGDFPDQDLLSMFDYCFKHITKAHKNDASVYVHCRGGVSRSATIVIAFLMQKHRLTYSEARRRVEKKRKIFPNDGFVQQLLLFERMKFTIDGYCREYREFLLKTLTYKLRCMGAPSPPSSSASSGVNILETTNELIKWKQETVLHEANCVHNYFDKISSAERLTEELLSPPPPPTPQPLTLLNNKSLLKTDNTDTNTDNNNNNKNSSRSRGLKFHCILCGFELFSELNIIGGRGGGGGGSGDVDGSGLSDGHHSYDSDLLDSDNHSHHQQQHCRTSGNGGDGSDNTSVCCGKLFIEPLETYWTQTTSRDMRAGHLMCPNCDTSFGDYNWLLFSCDVNDCLHNQYKECLALKVRSDRVYCQL